MTTEVLDWERISRVLLADGWHDIQVGSFLLVDNGHPTNEHEEGFTFLILEQEDENSVAWLRVWAQSTSILAIGYWYG